MKYFKKLNQKGFSHHILVPIAVIAVVTAIGSYVLVKSKAATLPTTSSSAQTTTRPANKVIVKNASSPPSGVDPLNESSLSAMATATTATTLPPPIIYNYPATIRYGDKNNTVSALQGILRYEFGASDAYSDGYFKFGTHVLNHVKALQSYYHLTVDGIVGPQTWKLIFTLVSNIHSQKTKEAAPPISSFALLNVTSGIKFYYKTLNPRCGQFDADRYNATADGLMESVGLRAGYAVFDASSGPNLFRVTYSQCSDLDNPGTTVGSGESASTWVTIQH